MHRHDLSAYHEACISVINKNKEASIRTGHEQRKATIVYNRPKLW